ncbi:MAG: MBL fold metallo-hydrolase [Clostridiales bacterium]|nr:MBL fold metallo-hydrolase [Clostridiales bacterium]
MSIRSEYEEYLSRQEKVKAHPMARIWVNQESRYVKPFQMYGNLYYVGDSWVCAHLVDTGKGLLLFDAGNCGNAATAMLIQAIWEAGFNPADVRWLVLSHGHVDHIGAANFFRKMFGTRLYLGAPDAEMFRTRPEYALIHESTDCMDELFAPDVEIQDGDVIRFGDTEVTFYLVPGHTEGVISCFFDVTDGMETKRVGYYGGFGFNTLQKDFLIEFGDPGYRMREVYLRSIQKVRDQKVDIFMPNHTNNVDLLNKRQYMLDHPGENPFVDDQAWKNYLDMKYADLLKLMADPAQN